MTPHEVLAVKAFALMDRKRRVVGFVIEDPPEKDGTATPLWTAIRAQVLESESEGIEDTPSRALEDLLEFVDDGGDAW